MGDDSAAGTSLLCGESRDFIGSQESEELSCCESLEEADGRDMLFMPGDEREYVEELIRKEPGWGFDCRSSSSKDSFRFDAVNWIINTSALFGFHFHTIYLSITYFDRFLATRSIENNKSWAVRLLSVASLSLAAKMEECKVPALPDFCVQNDVFNNQAIKKMELLILATLEWRMASVTPYAYLHYFVVKFFGQSCDNIRELLLTAMDLVLAISREINSVDYKPSVVAAAAVLASSSDELTIKSMALKTCSISSGVSIDNERVYECYSLIQEIKVRNSKTPGNVINFSPRNISKDPCFNSVNGPKRRLFFNENHQTHVRRKMHNNSIE